MRTWRGPWPEGGSVEEGAPALTGRAVRPGVIDTRSEGRRVLDVAAAPARGAERLSQADLRLDATTWRRRAARRAFQHTMHVVCSAYAFPRCMTFTSKADVVMVRIPGATGRPHSVSCSWLQVRCGRAT